MNKPPRYFVKIDDGRVHSKHYSELAAESACQMLAGSLWKGEYIHAASVVDRQGACTFRYYDSQHRSD